jgi:hypothetical protein
MANINIEELIKEKRPNLSNSSLKTYDSILRNLHKKVFNSEDYKKANYDDVERIIKYLKDLEPRKRKTILSALVIITDKKEYRDLMLDDIKEYNKEEAKQTKTKEQENNWIDKQELEDLYTFYYKLSKTIYEKKQYDNRDYQQIQDFIILSLLGGVFIPPRRSKDYVNFKIRNIDMTNDNYLKGNKLIFNSYKTAKTYGKQEINIPRPLKQILTKWIKINPTDYLLFDSQGNQLSNVKLNQRLNKLFGKKASVNQLRKTYLSDKYGDLIDKHNELKKDFKDMGSSELQETIYIKK